MNQNKKISLVVVSLSLVLGALLISFLGFGTAQAFRFWRDWQRFQYQVQNGEAPALPESARENAEESVSLDQASRAFEGREALVGEFSCEDVARTLNLFRTYLVYPPSPFRVSEYASALIDSVDPLGYWSLDESALLHQEISSQSRELKNEVDVLLRANSLCFQSGTCSCRMHESLARVAVLEMKSLREAFEKGVEHARQESPQVLGEKGDMQFRKEDLEFPHEDAPKKKTVRSRIQLLKDAEALGQKLERFSQKWVQQFESEEQKEEQAKSFVNFAEERYFPSYNEKKWASVILASSVKATVLLSDAYSEWAVQGEESEMMALDLSSAPLRPLWIAAHPNAVGIELEKGALSPLQKGDVLLRVCEEEELVHCKWLLGLSYEAAAQVSEMSFLQNEKTEPILHEVYVEVLRNEKREVFRVSSLEKDEQKMRDRFQIQSFTFGDTPFVSVKVSEIYEGFGEELRGALSKRNTTKEEVLILDLRNNGGGSVEDALSAMAYFLPDTAVIPVKSKNDLGQEIYEVLKTEALTPEHVFKNPLLVFVNQNTASAAEMISGVLQSYGRGIVIGRKTFGKGCMQEFFPVMKNNVPWGTLKITSALYALSNGQSVQRKGVKPNVSFPFSGYKEEDVEAEAPFPNTAPSFGFIDVREEPKKRAEYNRFDRLKFAAAKSFSCPDTLEKEMCGALKAFAKSSLP